MSSRVLVVLTVVVALTLPLASASAVPATAAARPAAQWTPPPDDHWSGHGTDPTNPQACDPIDPALCMLPYPNDWFTRPDVASATGQRLDLNVLGMPRNAQGKPIQPDQWNRNDGFSAGSQILTDVPGMTRNEDLAPSRLPAVTDLAETARTTWAWSCSTPRLGPTGRCGRSSTNT